MEGYERVQIGAGIAMLVVCLVVGAIEGSTVFVAATPAYFALWILVVLGFLAGTAAAVMSSAPVGSATSHLLVLVPVATSSAIVLMSPNRGGLVLILLVLSAAMAALRAGIGPVIAVIAWNSLVIVASLAALGPLVEEPNTVRETLVFVLIYAMLQTGTAGMAWSEARITAALQDLSAAHVELRSASVLLAESSQAEERLRISRDLHDVLGHQLTALALELETASHRSEGPEREHVLRARGVAKDLLGNVRSVVGDERHRAFDLEGALAKMLDEIPRPRTHLELSPGLGLSDDQARTLLLGVQEIATNAIRHSEALNLWVRVAGDGSVVRLEAQDDGRGAQRISVGNGLRGLRERVEALGGRVELDGGDGFRVRIDLPMHRDLPARQEALA